MSRPKIVQWDIHASDALAERRFYTDVFGWRCSHLDARDEYGWMFQADGGMVGGIGQAESGDTPGVAFFVQVDDVPACIERARALGGSVYWGPSSFPDGMVTACVADPEGNGVLLIRPSDAGEPYASRPPIDASRWQWEVQGADPTRLAAFYESLFGWSFDGLNEWEWGAMTTGPDGGPDGGIAKGDAPRVIIYVTVDDLRATLDRAVAHGGKIAVEPWDTSDTVSIALFTDPEGNRVGLRRVCTS